MLHDDDDYDSYFEDTMRAGHYENRKESVDIIDPRVHRMIIRDLDRVWCGICTGRMASFCTQEKAPIPGHEFLFHEDITGKEITTVSCHCIR